MEKIYNIKQASEFLGVSTRTLYRWEKKGQMEILNINGNRRVKESEIKRLRGEE